MDEVVEKLGVCLFSPLLTGVGSLGTRTRTADALRTGFGPSAFMDEVVEKLGVCLFSPTLTGVGSSRKSKSNRERSQLMRQRDARTRTVDGMRAVCNHG
jgi:hypothetical protein